MNILIIILKFPKNQFIINKLEFWNVVLVMDLVLQREFKKNCIQEYLRWLFANFINWFSMYISNIM